MIEDIVKIRPQTRKNYYSGELEFATPVVNPKQKARHFFQWGLVFHARGKPAEAYKYYEKAIFHHKFPLYLKQMGILHHEMGYFKDALKYLRTANAIEKELREERERFEARQNSKNATLINDISYSESYTNFNLKYVASSSNDSK